MLRFAFHTPLKPLDHPTPSGDRAMGRSLAALLQRLGHKVLPVDSHAAAGCQPMTPQSLPALRAAAMSRTQTLIDCWSRLAPDDPSRPTGWFTYHVWYKRPDWMGPAVARALAIPYVVAEASYAPKRASGPWDLGHRAAGEAIRAADLVLTVNPDDGPCLVPLLTSPEAMTIVPPFIDTMPFNTTPAQRAASRDRLRQRFGWPADIPVLLAVAMMRPPDKVASYRVLADAVMALSDRDWRLLVVGDGDARAEVEHLFAGVADRATFAGARTASDLPALYAGADLYVWPAINEAYGISMLEAQAAGLPVIAGRTRGVPAVVADGQTGLLAPLGDAAAFAIDGTMTRRAAAARAMP
jgi:glycosyltransferase involved in cell wall biosynthesis